MDFVQCCCLLLALSLTALLPFESWFQDMRTCCMRRRNIKRSNVIASKATECIVTMAIPDIHQKITYSVCGSCHQNQKARSGESFQYHTCKQEQTAEPRYKIIVHLSEDSKTLDAAIFDNWAEKLLNHTLEEIHTMTREEIAQCLLLAHQKIAGKTIIAQVRAPKMKFNDRITRYTDYN